MLISEKINAAFNEQIGNELGNSHQYIAIASFFSGECLFGLTKLFTKQAEEERDHAMRFVKFVLDAGGKVADPGGRRAPERDSNRPSRRGAARLRLRGSARPGRSTTWSSWRRPRRTTSR